MMRKYLLAAASLFAAITSRGAAGDTTWVQANVDTLSWYGNYDSTVSFPATGTYRNVYMIFTLGKYVCPGSPTYCGDWDYTVTNFLMTPGGDTLELSRLITPYANAGAPRTPWAWKQRYVFDVTDYAAKLQGPATIRLAYSGYSGGFTGDIKFAFVEGTPDRTVTGIRRLWHGGYGYGGATSINTRFQPISVAIPSATAFTDLKVNITGHGSDDSGCCEFFRKGYTVMMNGNPVDYKSIWRDDCGLNELYPQSGTWVYDRANWCPGALVKPAYHHIPGAAGGTSFDLSMYFDPYTSTGGGLGSYSTEAHLISYGSFNKTKDASIEDVIAPTNNADHFRENPICMAPTITVKNRGAAHISTVTIEYGVDGSPTQTYTWGGSLPSLEMTDIVLPDLPELYSLAGTTTTKTFTAKIKAVNGTADKDATNDIMKTEFVPSVKWDSLFRITFRTNSAAVSGVSESSWRIYDQNGAVVRSRTNLQVSKQYLDTISLTPGCYRLVVSDLGCDGLNWWASVGGGYMLLKKYGSEAALPTSGYVSSGTYGHDFGCQFIQSFYVGTPPPPSAVTEVAFGGTSMDIYPNPAADVVAVNLNGMSRVNGTITIFDAMGRVVASQPTTSTQSQVSTANLAVGAYMVIFTSQDGNKLQSKLLIAR
ncbi:MAG: T9SS type A sorting domain-containing protein [Taibaiella sp.]|nr:T9SS type A sorting domain-containing protein [Taibaiella sp.]